MTVNIPMVIRNNRFTDDGFVHTAEGLMVPAYVGSAKGFDEESKKLLRNFYRRLSDSLVFPICPFQAASEFLGSIPKPEESYQKHYDFWNRFNTEVIPMNRRLLMPKSKLLVAICEGQYVDEGVASEIAHFVTKGYGPVIGIRTDFRLGENIASPINPAVLEYFSDNPDSRFFNGTGSYERALDYMQGLAAKMLSSRNHNNH